MCVSAIAIAIRGSPRIASDHRPATSGVVRTKAPNAINRAPAMRFPMAPAIDGIGIYPSSIDALVLTKPLLEKPAVQGNRPIFLEWDRFFLNRHIPNQLVF